MTNYENYLATHHLPSWYEACREFTPRTVFTDEQADFEDLVSNLGWKKVFVKDYVKSLTTSRGSIAENASEVREILDDLKKYRGGIEGGVALREFEELIPESEQRYFVLKGTAYSRNDELPDLVAQIAERIKSPFYSVDLVLDTHGRHRLIELGDGQVSDTKKWELERFVNIFANA